MDIRRGLKYTSVVLYDEASETYFKPRWKTSSQTEQIHLSLISNSIIQSQDTLTCEMLVQSIFHQPKWMIMYSTKTDATLDPSRKLVRPKQQQHLLKDTSNYLMLGEKEKVHSIIKNHGKSLIQQKHLKHFAKFTGKHLCWSLFFGKFANLVL